MPSLERKGMRSRVASVRPSVVLPEAGGPVTITSALLIFCFGYGEQGLEKRGVLLLHRQFLVHFQFAALIRPRHLMVRIVSGLLNELIVGCCPAPLPERQIIEIDAMLEQRLVFLRGSHLVHCRRRFGHSLASVA